MKNFGGTMFYFGVGSVILYFLQMKFIVLAWIDLWGPGIGWGIRAGLIGIGGLLWLLGKAQESGANEEAVPE